MSYLLICLLVVVYIMHMFGHACYSTCVEVREQLHGISSLFPPLHGFWDQTQVTRLLRQVPLPVFWFFIKACLSLRRLSSEKQDPGSTHAPIPKWSFWFYKQNGHLTVSLSLSNVTHYMSEVWDLTSHEQHGTHFQIYLNFKRHASHFGPA